MRYSDVLLRAAECENEVNGPTQQAIDWINEVRRRANLNDLQAADYAGNADKLFEQIANVERPKEFGCEAGRCYDLIRWGFFYNAGRLQQLKEHGVYSLRLALRMLSNMVMLVSRVLLTNMRRGMSISPFIRTT